MCTCLCGAYRASAPGENAALTPLSSTARWVYPVTWGLAEGSNTISSTAEAVWYGVLDLITKVSRQQSPCVFGGRP